MISTVGVYLLILALTIVVTWFRLYGRARVRLGFLCFLSLAVLGQVLLLLGIDPNGWVSDISKILSLGVMVIFAFLYDEQVREEKRAEKNKKEIVE